MHAESSVPASQKLDVFGPVDSSSFSGLGLAQTLSDYLEGSGYLQSRRIHISKPKNATY